MSRKRIIKRLFPFVCFSVCLFTWLMASSCGYRFSGQSVLPGGAVKIFVGMFENRSLETGAEHVFTNALIKEILRTTQAGIVDSSNADANITGVLTSITLDTLSRSSDDSVVERVVWATLDLTMRDPAGKVLWSVTGFTEKAEYTVSSSNETDEAAQKEGIKEIALRISERLVSRMTDDF